MAISFGVNTWTWVSPFRTEDGRRLFPKIKEMGFDLVEIALEDPSLVEADTLRQELDHYGLGATVCGAFGPSRGVCDPGNGAPNDCFVIGYDCSGLAMYAWGASWWAHYAATQYVSAGRYHPSPSNLLPGDLILRAGRAPVYSPEDLRRALREPAEHGPLLLLVRRDGFDFWTALPQH